MSDSLAHYSFLPWLRQGMATKIEEEDTLGTSDGIALERAELEVELVLENTKVSDSLKQDESITKTLKIVGPGDIVGVNESAILRTEPNRNVNNFEPNLLPYIEFYEEDFPWRYSPAHASGTGATTKLRPWLALVILKNDEFTLTENTNGLSVVSITGSSLNSALYDPAETWAWAHVHLNESMSKAAVKNGTLDASGLAEDVDEALENDPDVGVSRLLCPRKLQKSTGYTGFLIPTFETGRLAGLGQEITGVKAQATSWQESGGNITVNEISGVPSNSFPFYFHWSFSTGKYGDFETLVSILEPIAVDPESGKLPMDIQSPGFSLDEVANTELLGFEGALRPPAPDFVSDTFPSGSGDTQFVTKLRTILNLSVDSALKNTNGDSQATGVDNPFYSAPFIEDPIIVPPTYGYWHAMIKKLGEMGNEAWIEQLNLDPRYRGAAGLGTQAVIAQQEELMNEAWQQIGQINEANQKIREAELAKMTSKAVYKKHLSNAEEDRFASLTAPIHRVLFNNSNDTTVNTEFRASRVPLAARSAAFRKMTRPQKKGNKVFNQNTVSTSIHRSVITRFNTTNADANGNPEISAAKLKIAPELALTFGDTLSVANVAITNYQSNNIYLARDLLFMVVNDAATQGQLQSKLTALGGSYSQAVRNIVDNVIDNVESFTRNGNEVELKIEKETYQDLFKNPSAGVGESSTPSSKQYGSVKISRDLLSPAEDIRIGKATNLGDIQNYVAAINGFQAVTSQTNFVTPMLRSPLPSIGTTFSNIRTRLKPEKTLEKKVIRSIRVWKDGMLKPIEELKPIMAYPEFTEPMYEELSKISQDFILPNVDKLPADSLTLLETNQAFIESYLAGLNHELSRELLWREYPTDQRGSYFRQFWDTTDNIFETDEEAKKDIKEMHNWTGSLGSNPPAGSTEANLVLVVRGQLLLKYPNTVVYAQRAIYDSDDPTNPRQLPDEITEDNSKFPIFSAELAPDVFLFGFDLTAPVAKGERAPSSTSDVSSLNPGWFFVFRERPGQIKFGLDDYADELGNEDVLPTGNPETWNDLSWEHLVSSKAELEEFTLRLADTVTITEIPAVGNPDPKWGTNSADLASILYQNPVIFARHAQEML